MTHAFLEWVKPTLALLAAASIMAATTDTVRSVLRPEEFALQRLEVCGGIAWTRSTSVLRRWWTGNRVAC